MGQDGAAESLYSLAWSMWSFNSFLSLCYQNSLSLRNDACKHAGLLLLTFGFMEVKKEPWNVVRMLMNRKQAVLEWAATVLLRLMFSVSSPCTCKMQNSPNPVRIFSRALEEVIFMWVSYRSHPKLTVILIHHVAFDALPWTLVYPFVEWVLDSFRDALSIHLVVVCKNISFHLLLFFISKCLWKGFNLICCHSNHV